MGFMDKSVDRYLHELVPARDAVLSEIEQLAAEKGIPIVGPAVGRLFEQLGRLVGARRVFEMGSAVGYSTIWWARTVGPAGSVYYTDGSAVRTGKHNSVSVLGIHIPPPGQPRIQRSRMV